MPLLLGAISWMYWTSGSVQDLQSAYSQILYMPYKLASWKQYWYSLPKNQTGSRIYVFEMILCISNTKNLSFLCSKSALFNREVLVLAPFNIYRIHCNENDCLELMVSTPKLVLKLRTRSQIFVQNKLADTFHLVSLP